MVDATRKPALRPRDAATLIILRRDSMDGVPRILMGKRHEAHKFMPNKFVFPGGRVDPGDCRVQPEATLNPLVEDRLLTKMRGKPSPARAQGLAMAAVRETFEECGLIVGHPIDSLPRTRSLAWQSFYSTGYAPTLDGLNFFARAITPPGRPRRFDTRFFVIEAEHVRNIDAPFQVPTQELLDPYWLTIAETSDLDLPWITGEILRRLEKALASPAGLTPDMPCTYQRMIGKHWHYEQI
jgi:8-oxo-dGTP pyrophosphatase MutT (NUDIX family)